MLSKRLCEKYGWSTSYVVFDCGSGLQTAISSHRVQEDAPTVDFSHTLSESAFSVHDHESKCKVNGYPEISDF